MAQPPVSDQVAHVDELIGDATRFKRLDYDLVGTLAEEAYEIACQVDPGGNQYRYGMASALALLAHRCAALGEADNAMQHASEALALLDSHDPSPMLGDLYVTMGWAHYLLGDYVDAMNRLLVAQDIAEKINDRSLAAYVMDRIANVYHATSRASLALYLQRRAIAIQHELGDELGAALTMNNMTYSLMDLDQFDEALEVALEAMRISEEHGLTYLLMGVLDTLAEVHRRTGDLDTAAAYSLRSLRLAGEHHSEPDRGDALYTTALIALQQGRLDDALAAARDALAINTRHGRSIEEFYCHELLSRVQEQRGELGAALEHYRRFHDLERIRLNEETSSRLANLQVEHEVATARKDAEIHRLRSLALEQEVEQRRIAQAELEAQASLDALTGLFNRRHVSVLSQELRREMAQGHRASLILIDIDHFKEINDTHGHFAGDRALVSIARLLRENARDADTPVRYGGDEFLVLLAGTGAEKAKDIAERLRNAIESEPVRYRGASIPITVSIGVASVGPGSHQDMHDLIERADRALYAAKHAGRNCVVGESL
ncbi:MAG: diguanylate cyclase [Coriobacteriia bacterium]|nr:diguanylate cyclase [Coriobacteriia bacterium]